MKRFLFLAAICLLGITACSETEESMKSKVVITSAKTMNVSHEGGVEEITYKLENPTPGVAPSAECAASWITDITYGVSIKFNVERNREKQERSAEIKIVYGSMTEVVTVVQAGREGDYDVDYKATIFGGEYYGTKDTDNYNYYVQLGDAEINAENDVPNGTYYYFDIYSDVRSRGELATLPNGSYSIDASNSGNVGTIAAKYSKMEVNGADGKPATSVKILAGTVEVTDGKFEATLLMEGGLMYHVVYEGELTMKNTLYNPGPNSTLTKDLEFEHENASMWLFSKGDNYGLGVNGWNVYLIEKETQMVMSGDFFTLHLITDNNDATLDGLIGTYTATSDLEPKKNSFLQGIMEGASALSWYYYTEDGILDNSCVAPVYKGTITFEKDGNNVIVTLDCEDDKNHKIKGTYNCSSITQF